MYRTITESGTRNQSVAVEALISICQFVLIFAGSFLIGALSALLVAFILKRQAVNTRELKRQLAEDKKKFIFHQKQNVNAQVAVMILCPWVSYLIAEGLELSGIVSILCNGIFLSQYAQPNLSKSSRRVLSAGYETAAYSCETLVFLFLGMGLFAFNHPYEQMGVPLLIGTIINLNIARALNVLIVTGLLNKFRTKNKFSGKLKFVMWFSGLRGAMAYALAMKSSIDFKLGSIMLLLTLIYALISILLIGSILNPVLDRCDVKNKGEEEEDVEHEG